MESATVYGGYVAGVVPRVEIQNLWGIYSSGEQEFEANQAIIRDIEDLVLAETGGVILNHNWFADNDQFLFCREKIDTVDGFLGKKTRSHSAALSDWINGMGASALYLAFGDVYKAIARNSGLRRNRGRRRIRAALARSDRLHDRPAAQLLFR